MSVVDLVEAISSIVNEWGGAFEDDGLVHEDAVDGELIVPILSLCCQAVGHVPMRDQCGRPEHDYCARCRAIVPGAAGR